MNSVTLIGNLGADAEVKTFDNGGSVIKLRLATTEKWKDKNGEQKEKTEWHHIDYSVKNPENLAKYLTKGRPLAVQGKLTYNAKENNGQKTYFTTIRADRVEFVGGTGGTKNTTATDSSPAVEDFDDTFPPLG